MIVFSFRDRECMCRFEFEIMMIEEQEHERKWPIVLTKSKRKQLDFTVWIWNHDDWGARTWKEMAYSIDQKQEEAAGFYCEPKLYSCWGSFIQFSCEHSKSLMPESLLIRAAGTDIVLAYWKVNKYKWMCLQGFVNSQCRAIHSSFIFIVSYQFYQQTVSPPLTRGQKLWSTWVATPPSTHPSL
jgi:hypothetical protein